MARFTIDVGERFDKMLSDLAENEETTKAEIIRRAVALYAVVKPAANAGEKILLTPREGSPREVIVP